MPEANWFKYEIPIHFVAERREVSGKPAPSKFEKQEEPKRLNGRLSWLR